MVDAIMQVHRMRDAHTRAAVVLLMTVRPETGSALHRGASTAEKTVDKLKGSKAIRIVVGVG